MGRFQSQWGHTGQDGNRNTSNGLITNEGHSWVPTTGVTIFHLVVSRRRASRSLSPGFTSPFCSPELSSRIFGVDSGTYSDSSILDFFISSPCSSLNLLLEENPLVLSFSSVLPSDFHYKSFLQTLSWFSCVTILSVPTVDKSLTLLDHHD